MPGVGRGSCPLRLKLNTFESCSSCGPRQPGSLQSLYGFVRRGGGGFVSCSPLASGSSELLTTLHGYGTPPTLSIHTHSHKAFACRRLRVMEGDLHDRIIEIKHFAHPAFLYLAISSKKTLPLMPFLIPAMLLSPLSSSKCLAPHCSRFIPLSPFSSHSFPPLSNSIPSHFCKEEKLVVHPYSALGLSEDSLASLLISGTVTLGPPFLQHGGTSLALHFVFPFSQPPRSLPGEAWISELFPSVMYE